MLKFFSILAYIILVILRPTEPIALALGDTGNEKMSLKHFPGKAQIGKGKGKGHPITGYKDP
jgi:hypothetical protein